MLISRDQAIAGRPAVEMRGLMRTIRNAAVSLGLVAQELDVDPDVAESLLDDLERLGFVGLVAAHERSYVLGCQGEPIDEDALWGTTILGNALAKARIGNPMPRSKARVLCDEFLGRVAAVNADPESAFLVDRVGVFGSFADPSIDEVGDVDVHVVFSRRVTPDRYREMVEEAASAAERAGHRFRSPFDRMVHLESQFRAFLSGRSWRLDVQFSEAGGPSQVPDGVEELEVYVAPE